MCKISARLWRKIAMTVEKLKWNDDYGDWQVLASDIQEPRYQEIARIVGEFCPSGSVLDVGCGEAVLAPYLPESVTYAGIEPSAKALAASIAKVPCRHTTAEDFTSGGERWDCIIFNEMLYYSQDPQSLLLKFSSFLKPNGIVIISIYQKRDSLRARLGFSMTNARCTRIVKALVAREQWTVERDQRIDRPHRQPWWLLVARPKGTSTQP
jgi:2-polyprenyl-3-methyl-5-hydroxy-6-metoxy-1,4-benzoquinol methylase